MRKTIKTMVPLMLAFFLLAAGLFIPAAQRPALAQDDGDNIELVGNADGLVLVPEGAKLFDLGNLNPGDKVESALKIQNNYESPFALYVKAERVGEEEENDLLNQLLLTVTYKGVEIYSGPATGKLDDEPDLANGIYLGSFQPGDSGELVATVELPGAETGNEFQGKSAQINWIFFAESAGDGDDDGDDDDDDDDNGRDDREDEEPSPQQPPTEEIEDEPIPEGAPETTEQPASGEQVIEPEPVPAGAPEMPKTGEPLPYPFYVIGGFAILAGLGLLKSKKQ